jgi:putative transposase
MKFTEYDSSLTDYQWELLRSLLPVKKSKRGRPPLEIREVIDAILYVLKAGVQWRYLPKDFPNWKSVYHYFRKWTKAGLWFQLVNALRPVVRQLCGKHEEPTAAVIDSQTVRSDGHGGETSYDAAKKTKGRKRFLCVDTLGMILDSIPLPAATPERDGAKRLLETVLIDRGGLKKIFADSGFSGPAFAQWVAEQNPAVEVEIVNRIEGKEGFHILPKRWVVDRTFGWLMRHRRLVRDYERLEETARAWVLLAGFRIMLNRVS